MSRIPHRLFCVAPSPYVGALYLTERDAVCPNSRDPDYIDWIIEFCRANEVHVMLPDAADFVAIARHRVAIRRAAGTIVLAQPDPVIAIAENKLSTSIWLEEQGLAHPRYALSDNEAAVKALANAVGYPLVAKPYVGECSEGMMLISNAAEISRAAQRNDMLISSMSVTTPRSTPCLVSLMKVV